jgi:hypothetical protein
LIHCVHEARDSLIDGEEGTDEELQRYDREFRRLHEQEEAAEKGTSAAYHAVR